ncbi:Acetyltransferase (GNAT) family protein [Halorubrum xinjiangense]|uniref:Acetyltransferase (GNAT) family protein n=1 Tax=Halorubrum xinjiangense TaxID=261291 RepID=A0A1G7MQ94_9EURY|nr:GNAT family N-acetyltransferase [Halorubrum xinjiangense]SDF63945.1 Acetyltransferase (GNAT) family protein [Halorubrum xinjiangense]
MEYALVCPPGEGETLRLDYRAFAYAGKFVVGAPGKSVIRTPDGRPAAPDWEPDEPLPDTVDPAAFDEDVIAAVSFSSDRTDPACCRLRYVTVHAARRGEGIGPRLIDETVADLAVAGFDRVRIAVNNPFAYEACHKCGFAYTGERTGIAELELERPAGSPADVDPERYREGLAAFRETDGELSRAERRFVAERLERGPPQVEGGTDSARER